MGGSNKKPKQPEPPQPTVKELAKQFSRDIRKMRREFERTTNSLKMNNTKIMNEIKRMVEKKQPRQNIKIVAQNLIKNRAYLSKYARLDAQLADVDFKLQSMATTDSMVSVLKGMTNILKINEKTMNIKDIQKSMQEFMRQQEKQELMNEQIEDIMTDDDVSIDNDAEVDKIIDEVAKGNKQENVNKDADIDQLEKQLADLK